MPQNAEIRHREAILSYMRPEFPPSVAAAAMPSPDSFPPCKLTNLLVGNSESLHFCIHIMRSSLAFPFIVLLAPAPLALYAERVVIVAGGGDQVTGAATNCRLHAPFAIDFDRSGNMYIAEMAGGERVLKVDPHGMLTVYAGTGQKGDSGDGGLANQAPFNGMHSIAIGPGGDLVIAATLNSPGRKWE